MASIRKQRGKWQAQVRRHGCKPVSKTFHLKDDAVAWARRIEREADREGVITDRTPLRTTTVADLLDRYASQVTPTKKSSTTEAGLIKTIRKHTFVSQNLESANPNTFSKFRDNRIKSVSGATVRRELEILHHVFEVARREWGLPIRDNPVAKVKKPPSAKARDRRVTDAEEARLLEACETVRNPEIRPYIILALETGMRRSELSNLSWQFVDHQRRIVHIPDTKNGEARDVPLSARAAHTLAHLHHDGKQGAQVFTSTQNALRLCWEHVRANAGLRDIRWHDLRHEAISRMFEKGLNIMEVGTISGHKELRMLRRYTHLDAGKLAEKLD